MLVAGEEVGDVFRGGKAYDMQVWSTPETRNSLTAIERLPIDTPGGGRVRLAEVADVRVVLTPSQIECDQGSRRLDRGANVVEGADLAAIVSDIEAGL